MLKNNQVQFQKSISKINFKNQFQKSISKINFKNQFQIQIVQTETLNPKLETQNPKLETRNPQLLQLLRKMFIIKLNKCSLYLSILIFLND